MESEKETTLQPIEKDSGVPKGIIDVVARTSNQVSNAEQFFTQLSTKFTPEAGANYYFAYTHAVSTSPSIGPLPTEQDKLQESPYFHGSAIDYFDPSNAAGSVFPVFESALYTGITGSIFSGIQNSYSDMNGSRYLVGINEWAKQNEKWLKGFPEGEWIWYNRILPGKYNEYRTEEGLMSAIINDVARVRADAVLASSDSWGTKMLADFMDPIGFAASAAGGAIAGRAVRASRISKLNSRVFGSALARSGGAFKTSMENYFSLGDNMMIAALREKAMISPAFAETLGGALAYSLTSNAHEAYYNPEFRVRDAATGIAKDLALATALFGTFSIARKITSKILSKPQPVNSAAKGVEKASTDIADLSNYIGDELKAMGRENMKTPGIAPAQRDVGTPDQVQYILDEISAIQNDLVEAKRGGLSPQHLPQVDAAAIDQADAIQRALNEIRVNLIDNQRLRIAREKLDLLFVNQSDVAEYLRYNSTVMSEYLRGGRFTNLSEAMQATKPVDISKMLSTDMRGTAAKEIGKIAGQAAMRGAKRGTRAGIKKLVEGLVEFGIERTPALKGSFDALGAKIGQTAFGKGLGESMSFPKFVADVIADVVVGVGMVAGGIKAYSWFTSTKDSFTEPTTEAPDPQIFDRYEALKDEGLTQSLHDYLNTINDPKDRDLQYLLQQYPLARTPELRQRVNQSAMFYIFQHAVNGQAESLGVQDQIDLINAQSIDALQPMRDRIDNVLMLADTIRSNDPEAIPALLSIARQSQFDDANNRGSINDRINSYIEAGMKHAPAYAREWESLAESLFRDVAVFEQEMTGVNDVGHEYATDILMSAASDAMLEVLSNGEASIADVVNNGYVNKINKSRQVIFELMVRGKTDGIPVGAYIPDNPRDIVKYFGLLDELRAKPSVSGAAKKMLIPYPDLNALKKLNKALSGKRPQRIGSGGPAAVAAMMALGSMTASKEGPKQSIVIQPSDPEVIDFVTVHEGFKTYTYPDPSENAYLTIGKGFAIDTRIRTPEETDKILKQAGVYGPKMNAEYLLSPEAQVEGAKIMTEQQANKIAAVQIEEKYNEMLLAVPNVVTLPPEVQMVVLDMFFNGGNLSKSMPKSMAALRQGDLNSAYWELKYKNPMEVIDWMDMNQTKEQEPVINDANRRFFTKYIWPEKATNPTQRVLRNLEILKRYGGVGKGNNK